MKASQNSYSKPFIHFYILVTMSLANCPSKAGIGMCDNLFSELRVELGLPLPVVNTLRKRGINTVKKLTAKTPEELLKLPFISIEYLKEIEIALTKKKLTLKSAPKQIKPKRNQVSSDTTPSLSSLELSNRVRNVLRAEGITTVEELTGKTEQELLKIPNLGITALKKIKQALAQRNLTLKSIPETMRQKRSLNLKSAPKNMRQERNLVSSDTTPSLSSLELSNRVRNVLRAEGITIVEELEDKTEQELLKIPNLGTTALKRIKQALAQRNLTLKNPRLDPSSILSLDISSKATSALKKLKINTIEELTSQTEQDLMWMPNFGKTSLEEIKKALTQRNLSLSKAHPNFNSILSLGISVYYVKILQIEGITTVKELTGKTKRELLKLPYMSQRALWEIESSLAKRSLYLKDSTLN